ncbi:MAG: nickel-responsive transcriptional regulator NikR [Desulfovibrio sp.]|jgi:CopG family nickel-responsive transcriptional regulator|nr:nickel-responsive transcriptional regulator NikR [Desulfovibrio sp.]
MGTTIRFGVSLDSDLLERFDALCDERGYQTRSEAIRDLIRNTLVNKEWEDDDANVAATLTLVYDHHKSDLAQRVTNVQHDHHHLIITTMHVHLDHHNCLEVLVLKGPGNDVRGFAQNLISTKGVMFGKLSLATTGENLC